LEDDYLEEETEDYCSDLSYRECGGGWKWRWIVSNERVLTLLIKELVIVDKGKYSYNVKEWRLRCRSPLPMNAADRDLYDCFSTIINVKLNRK
jgi:hypothetical protein